MTECNAVNLFKAVTKSVMTAQDYLTWAQEAKKTGDEEAMRFFGTRAQEEIDKDMTEAWTHLQNCLESGKPDMIKSAIADAQMEDFRCWADKIIKGVERL